MEDAQGHLRHTVTVCYDDRSHMPLFPDIDRAKEHLDLHEDEK